MQKSTFEKHEKKKKQFTSEQRRQIKRQERLEQKRIKAAEYQKQQGAQKDFNIRKCPECNLSMIPVMLVRSHKHKIMIWRCRKCDL